MSLNDLEMSNGRQPWLTSVSSPALFLVNKEIKMNIVVMMPSDKTHNRTGQSVAGHDRPDVVVRMMVMIFSSSSCSSIIITLVLRAEG